MADIEKVIKGLECCTRYEVGKQLNNCLDCPYVEQIGFNQFRCKSQEMKEDAIELLKSQPKIARCKDCKYYIEKTDDEPSSCLIKAGYFPVSGDWYCADGEAKE